MTDKERGQNIQFLILPSTIAVVDKGTSLHCYYVKMCRTGFTCIFIVEEAEKKKKRKQIDEINGIVKYHVHKYF